MDMQEKDEAEEGEEDEEGQEKEKEGARGKLMADEETADSTAVVNHDHQQGRVLDKLDTEGLAITGADQQQPPPPQQEDQYLEQQKRHQQQRHQQQQQQQQQQEKQLDGSDPSPTSGQGRKPYDGTF